MDIVEFLRARLDEDETTARAAANGVTGIWQAENGGVLYGSDLADWPEESGNGVVVYDEGSPLPTQAEHIARHDPARMLREVEAKRQIVADLAELVPYRPREDYDNTDNVWAEIQADQAERHLRLLASVWSEHPDYDENWRP